MAAPGADAAAQALARVLQPAWGADVVALGWRAAHAPDAPTRLAACEPAVPQERRDALIAALDEAMDQGCALTSDPMEQTGAAPGTLLPVNLAQRLAAAGGGHVLTVPLPGDGGADDRPGRAHGAVCLCRAAPWTADDVERLSHLLACMRVPVPTATSHLLIRPLCT